MAAAPGIRAYLVAGVGGAAAGPRRDGANGRRGVDGGPRRLARPGDPAAVPGRPVPGPATPRPPAGAPAAALRELHGRGGGHRERRRCRLRARRSRRMGSGWSTSSTPRSTSSPPVTGTTLIALYPEGVAERPWIRRTVRGLWAFCAVPPLLLLSHPTLVVDRWLPISSETVPNPWAVEGLAPLGRLLCRGGYGIRGRRADRPGAAAVAVPPVQRGAARADALAPLHVARGRGAAGSRPARPGHGGPPAVGLGGADRVHLGRDDADASP